jgi:hypothetical protein
MTNQHRATPEQWEYQERWASDDDDASCILELRDRVEALERQAAMTEVRAASAEVRPAKGLVVRVSETNNSRDAIRAVAAWLEAKSEAHLGSGKFWAKRLNQEADCG